MPRFLNDALYSATHPSYTSNGGPTATIFSRYVDVVSVVLLVVLPETDGRPIVVVCNSQQDRISLIIIYARNGSVSVHERIWCISRQQIGTLWFLKNEA